MGTRRVLPKIKFEGVPNRIHPNDFMLFKYSKEGLEAYRKSGQCLVKQLQEVFEEYDTSWNQIEAFLELGCGYGRHTRWLAQHMPAHLITVADVIREAVDFCVSEFGVKGVDSSPDINYEQFEKYTIIYAFSVLTHVSERRVDNFFRLLDKCLLPGGIALFTVYGPHTFEFAYRTKSYLDLEKIRREVGCM